jgi:hypothetical protein
MVHDYLLLYQRSMHKMDDQSADQVTSRAVRQFTHSATADDARIEAAA